MKLSIETPILNHREGTSRDPSLLVCARLPPESSTLASTSDPTRRTDASHVKDYDHSRCRTSHVARRRRGSVDAEHYPLSHDPTAPHEDQKKNSKTKGTTLCPGYPGIPFSGNLSPRFSMLYCVIRNGFFQGAQVQFPASLSNQLHLIHCCRSFLSLISFFRPRWVGTVQRKTHHAFSAE